jgi:alpha-1,6-mannosyltransferase
MKIADVSGFYSDAGGGVKSYVLQKFAEAARQGHQLTVIAPGIEDRIEPREGGKVVWIKGPAMPGDPNYRLFLNSERVWRVLDAVAPDVVEGSSPWRGGWIAGAWPGDAARALVFHQDFVAGYPYTALGGVFKRDTIDGLFSAYWRYVRRLSERFDVTVAGGEWLAQRLEGFGVRRPVSVPFGIEAGRFSPALRDEVLRRDLLAGCGVGPHGTLLIAVGRFHPEKRHATIIEGFARARAVNPGLALAVIGDGPIRPSIEAAAARVGGVVLTGAITDRDRLARHYASADILVHGSAAETYGLVVAEAIVSGLPVVTPDAGGAADLAKRGRSAIYETGDPAACAEAILRVVATGGAPPTAQPPGSAEDHFTALFGLYQRLVDDRRRLGLDLAETRRAG